jgi:glycosyltransferase involved in cell wall biosynthesis
MTSGSMIAVPPLRVALVTQGYQSAGGVQTVARWLVRGLRASGHSVHIFNLATSRDDPHSRRLLRPFTWLKDPLLVLDADEPDVTHVGANGTELEILRYLPRRNLDDALNEYDVVQVVAGGPALAWAASRANPPTALQAATTVRRERQSMLARQSPAAKLAHVAMTAVVTRIEMKALRNAATVLVENHEMASYVRSRAPRTVVTVAPPGVDIERFAPRADGWRGDGYLLSVCRLEDCRKGLERLVEAYSLLRERRADVPDLVLAGRNEPPASLIELIHDLGLSSFVQVRRNVPTRDLPGLYQGASVYLQTSFEEGLGLSVLEAMASGLPVVATETAGTLETVISGITGWLVPQGPDVAADVAEMVSRALNVDGPDMALAARERTVTTFSGAATLGNFLDSYALLRRERVR